MVKNGEDSNGYANDEFENFRVNFSRWQNRDIASLSYPALVYLYLEV